MTDRRAELEKKRLKLQQLREMKEQRRQEKDAGRGLMSEALGLSGTSSSGSGMASPSRGGGGGPASLNTSINSDAGDSLVGAGGGGGAGGGNRGGGGSGMSSIRTDTGDVDDILESIGIRSGGQNNHRANHTDSSSSLTNHLNHHNNTNSVAPNLTSPDSGTSSDAKPSPSGFLPSLAAPLTFSSIPQVLIAPKEHVTYEKQTQTTATQSTSSNNDRDSPILKPKKGGQLDYYVIHWDEEWDDEFQVLTYDDLGGEEGEDGSLFTVPYPTSNGTSHVSTQVQTKSSHTQQSQHHHNQQHRPSLPHVEMVRPAQTQDDLVVMAAEKEKEEKTNRRHEYKEEERRHLMQTEAFRKFLDRAVRITERALSCTDSMDIFVDYTGQVESVDNEDKSGLRLALNTTFMDERWSRGRAVTSFDWCTQFPELLVASYNQNDEAPNEPDGICLVWNMKFKKSTPEYVFHCQSPVMSACFAKFHPNLILGGTYSGQIVLWDNRSGKRVPVQRSPLSASAHTHPVYCLKVVGTQNSHNLISISNDGKLCSWSLDMLSAPQETMELCQQKQSRLIAVMSMSFPTADYNNFVLGSQDGSVFSACRHGAKAGILDVFDGHQGPVTAVDFHAAPSTQYDFSHLYLTSSFDWTFKLWSMREQNKPLYSFEDGSDYLYDVRWSPIHPALFATVDGLGRLDIWNLNNDTELPTVSTYVEGMSALNRLIWSPNGQQLVVGDDGGRIAVYDVGEQLAFPKNDEWSRFSHTLQEFTNNSIDI